MLPRASSLILALLVFLGGCEYCPSDEAMTAAIARYELSHGPQLAAVAPPQRVARTDSVLTGPDWAERGWTLAQAPAKAPLGAPQTAPAAEQAAAGWPARRGPAYPGDFWRSLGRDALEMPATFWDDAKATVTNRPALALIGLAGLAGAVVNNNWDDDVERHFGYGPHGHGSQLNSEWDGIGGFFGSPAFHFPLAGAMYLTSLIRDDVENYEKAKTLINALALTGATTISLKWAVNTESPNGDENGWPSGHTSSSFCLATVAYEEYGPWVGVPLLGFATFVGYERLDARNHDFSDVVSGALIGIAIGHAVSRNHQGRLMGMTLVPYTHPDGSTGLALYKRW